jgi:phosphoglycerate dehydrogenase-like enzyme
MNRINLLVTIPEPLRSQILGADTRALIDRLATPTYNADGHNWSPEELAAHLPGQEAVLASWGLAPLDERVLANADRLKIVAYAAGSVKGWANDALFERGIVISHAASRIADSVADYTLLLAMMGLRRPQDFDRQMKAGAPWPKPPQLEQYEISGRKVGLLGFGYVGRRTTALFRGVGAQVNAYDPYVPAEAMAAAGAIKAELDEILTNCQIVSVHLPVTPETRHLIGARELALLPAGCVFINTARAWVIDQEALLAELRRGRIWAALDVFEQEPLAVDHPFRTLDNVLLSPHVAGMTRDSYYGLTANMMAEIERFFQGEPLRYQVTREALARMA